MRHSLRSQSNILRRLEVQKRTGLTRSTLYDKISDRTFPEQVRLSAGCVGWYECGVEEWLANPR